MEISSAAQNGNRRIIWIDVLKCLAIFFVLWGHCIQHFTNSDFSNNPVFLFIYSFHMPLFMMLSGYFASKLEKRSFRDVFTSKFLQLLLPTIIFGIVYWLQSRFLLHQTHKDIISCLWYYFWFLKSLFVCIMLFYIGIRISPKKWIGLTMMLVISQLADITPYLFFLQLRYMFPCFVLGYALCHFKDYFYRYARIITPVSLAVWCLMLLGFNHDLLYPDIDKILQIGRDKIIYSIYYRLLIGIAGSLGVMGTIYLLCEKLKSNKILDRLAEYGRHTLAIYILQSFVVESWLKAIISYPVMPYSWLFSLVYAPIISVIALVICLMICFWLDKIKLGWLFDYNHLNLRS